MSSSQYPLGNVHQMALNPPNANIGAVMPFRAGAPQLTSDTAVFASQFVSKVTGKRFGAADPTMTNTLKRSLPSTVGTNMSVMHAGLSTLNAQMMRITRNDIFMKPTLESWEQHYTPNTPLFCNANEPLFDILGAYSIFSPPVINYLAQVSNITRNKRKPTQRDALGTLFETDELYDGMIGETANDFRQNWNFLGNMTTREASTYSHKRTKNANDVRLISYANWGRNHVYNMFGTKLRRGQQLFFIVKDYDTSALQTLVDPNGNELEIAMSPADRVSRAHQRTLQIRGFTDEDTSYCLSDTSDSHLSRNSNFITTSEPKERNVNYIQRERAVADEYQAIDFSETGDDTFRFVKDAEDGVQDALAAVPQFVYDAYQEGHVIPVGHVKSYDGEHVSSTQLSNAHRSQTALNSMPVVELWSVPRMLIT